MLTLEALVSIKNGGWCVINEYLGKLIVQRSCVREIREIKIHLTFPG